MGYTYVGPASFYKLTLHEMRRLHAGYAALHSTGNEGRDSDWDKLEEFKQKLRDRG